MAWLRRTLRSVFWAYNSYAVGLAISMLATAILARLLTPADFGLIALALVAIAILDTFPGLGVGEALVVVPDDDVEENAETAFAVSVLVGLVLAGLLAALGPFAAAFFDQPRLVEIMPVLGVALWSPRSARPTPPWLKEDGLPRAEHRRAGGGYDARRRRHRACFVGGRCLEPRPRLRGG